MTLTSTTNRVQYDGDDSTVEFPVTFVYWANADVAVVHTAADGTETTWVLGTQYTLSGGNGETGTLTVDTSPTDYTPATGETLTIYSNLLDKQETALPSGGPLPSAAVEQQIDKIVRLIQQKATSLAGALRIPISESSIGDLPTVDSRKGKVFQFNASTGDPEAGAVVTSIDTLATLTAELAALAAISANITTVAGISGNVTTVAGVAANVTTLAAISANITTAAGIAANITTVAGDSADIQALAALTAELAVLGALGTELSALAALDTEITALAAANPLAGLSAIGVAGGVNLDIPMQAGYSATMTGVNIEARDYYEIKIPRAFTATGEVASCGTAPTGADLIFDIEKNGTTIYTTKPEIAAGATTLTAGTLKTDGTEDFAAGDVLTFAVTQIGSTIPGQKALFTLKGIYA